MKYVISFGMSNLLDGTFLMNRRVVVLTVGVVFAIVMPSRSFSQSAPPGDGPKVAVKAKETTATSDVLPKPAVELTPGTWKYRESYVFRGHTDVATVSLTVKDSGAAWTVTEAMQTDFGPVTDVATLEKGTLVLRKELFTHFEHKDQPWKPVEIDVDLAGNRVTGVMKYVHRPDQPVAMDLGGPVFNRVGSQATIGCLPLAEGYSTTLRYFVVDRLPIKPQDADKPTQLKVVGTERVTVPAGTFDTWKVELAPGTGGPVGQTVWVAKDSRMTVKSIWVMGEMTGTSEMVP
jgi:hypothetical protein